MSANPRLAGLNRWSRSLLLVGGGLVAVYAGLFAVEAVTATTVPKSAVSGIAYLLVFAGVLGLHPLLVEGSPRLARLGAVCIALGGAGFAGVFVVNAGQLAGLVPTPGPGWFALVNLPAMIGMIPGFLLVGLAGLRTDRLPPAVGYLLIAPAVVFSVNVAAIGLGGPDALSAWASFAITLAEAVAVLGVARLLRSGGADADGTAKDAGSAAS